jgi:hypothetical protein
MARAGEAVLTAEGRRPLTSLYSSNQLPDRTFVWYTDTLNNSLSAESVGSKQAREVPHWPL